MLFAAKYAVKSIARRPKKNLGAILAIALGVTLLIGTSVGSNGIKIALANDWYGSTGQTDLAIYDTNNPIFPGTVSDTVLSNAELSHLDIVTHRLDQSLTFYQDGKLQKGVNVQGLEPEDQDAFGGFYNLDGNQLDASLLTGNSIFVNEVLAGKLGLEIGDKVSTSTFDGAGGSVPLELEVVGIIDPSQGRGLEDFFGDTSIAYVNIETLQSALVPQLQNYVSRIFFKFSGVDRSIEALNIEDGTFPGKAIIKGNLEATEEVLASLEGTYRVFSGRIQVAESVNDVVNGIASVLTLFTVILNAVGLLLIINVQSMSLDDRRYQTAVLRAMGSNKRQIFSVFMIESAITGIIGAIIGVGTGILYGQFVENTIVNIFGLSGTSGASFDPSLLTTAMIFGVALAVLTAVIPSWWAASRSITNELRGIDEETVEEGRSRKAFVIGLTTLLAGLLAAQNVGQFWTDDAWTSFEDATNILTALGFSAFGLGMLFSYINKRMGYNLAAVTIYGLAVFALFDRMDLITEGNGNNFLLVVMVYLVLGSVMLVIVNFDVIMAALHKGLSTSSKMRAISQVSTKQMMARKGRLAMVFTVLSLVLVLNIFVAISAESIVTANVDAYEVRSNGVDIVINSDVPNAQIEQVVEDLDEVQNVFAFRSFSGPLYRADPAEYSAEEVTSFLRFRNIVEFNQSEVNPDGDWGNNSLIPYTYRVNDIKVDGHQYEHELGRSHEENNDLSKQLLTQFWDNTQVEYEAELKDANWNVNGTEERTGHFVIGDFFSDFYQDVYFQDGNGETINAYQVGAMFNMLGNIEMLSGAILVTPELFAQLPQSQQVNEPNMFLVRSTVGYHNEEGAQALALKIEQVLNDLDDPESLSSQEGILLGATTRIVKEEVTALWEDEASFWNFLNIFAALGLIIGALGMVIIAVRSVQERTREIGMMRAIGFKRSTVVFTVALELIFVSAVGLIAGIFNGALMTTAFLQLLLEISPAYPIGLLALYVIGISSIAVIAGIVPGLRASRIPASEALRYTG